MTDVELACISENNTHLTNVPKLRPPDRVKGMLVLDRSKFNTTVTLPYIAVENVSLLETLLKCFKYKELLKIPNFRPVVNSQSSQGKEIYFNPERINTIDNFNERQKQCLEKVGISEILHRDVELNYDNFSHEAILSAVLPEQQNVSSYSIAGHILHLNLRDSSKPFKKLIGEVFLDKVKNISLVVNKTGNIDTEFRNFEMEVLATREENYTTVVSAKFGNLKFEFDWAKVYFNTRLGAEHDRIVQKLTPGCSVLYDVFAGVGAFALRAAKKSTRAFVHANDLNPDAFKWLAHNIKLNKQSEYVTAYNLDGRQFTKTVVLPNLLKNWLRKPEEFDVFTCDPAYHIVMNLPALAINFLDIFNNFFTSDDEIPENAIMPVVHCYCFVKSQEIEESGCSAEELIRRRVAQMLNNNKFPVQEIVEVRDVSPTKSMFRISFVLTPEILCENLKSNKRLKTH